MALYLDVRKTDRGVAHSSKMVFCLCIWWAVEHCTMISCNCCSKPKNDFLKIDRIVVRGCGTLPFVYLTSRYVTTCEGVYLLRYCILSLQLIAGADSASLHHPDLKESRMDLLYKTMDGSATMRYY